MAVTQESTMLVATARPWRGRLVCLLLFLWGAPAQAADSPLGALLEAIFRRDPPLGAVPAAEAIEDVLDPNAGAEFRPALNRLLSRELYFARKICQPTPAQFRELQAAGHQSVDRIVRSLAQAQRRGKSSSEWPQPRQTLTTALAAKVSEILPDEAAKRYQMEIAARDAAQRQAAQEMMVVIIDRKVTLQPDQYPEAAKALADKWDESWSRNLQIYLYEEYLQVPSETVLRPVLNDRQRKLYRTMGNRGQISFGWEQDLGLQFWGQQGGEVDEFGVLEDSPEAPASVAPAPETGQKVREEPAENDAPAEDSADGPPVATESTAGEKP